MFDVTSADSGDDHLMTIAHGSTVSLRSCTRNYFTTCLTLETGAFIGLKFYAMRLEFLLGMAAIAISLATASPNRAVADD